MKRTNNDPHNNTQETIEQHVPPHKVGGVPEWLIECSTFIYTQCYVQLKSITGYPLGKGKLNTRKILTMER